MQGCADPRAKAWASRAPELCENTSASPNLWLGRPLLRLGCAAMLSLQPPEMKNPMTPKLGQQPVELQESAMLRLSYLTSARQDCAQRAVLNVIFGPLGPPNVYA